MGAMLHAVTDLLARSATEIALAVPPGEPDPMAGKGPEWGKAAPAGLLIWLFLGIALFLLIKSMNKHLRRVPKNADGRASTALVSEGGTWVPRRRPAPDTATVAPAAAAATAVDRDGAPGGAGEGAGDAGGGQPET